MEEFNCNKTSMRFTSSIELTGIFEKIIIESESDDIKLFESQKLLSLFIRSHRNNINEIIKEFSMFIAKRKINIKLLVKCINTINKLLIEKNQLIIFYNLIIPNLIEIINKIKDEDIKTIQKIINCIENIICRINYPNIQKIENTIDFFLKKIFDDKFNVNSNNLYAIIQFIIIEIKNNPTVSFYKLISKNTFDLFLNLLKYFRYNNNEIRSAISELIRVFLNSIKNRDSETKNYYSKLFYRKISDEYITNLKLNANIPNDCNLLSGFILVSKKIFLFDSELSKKNYKKFLDDLFKCKISTKNEIKIEFIKAIPDLYYINKTIFLDKYLNIFFDYANSLLNIKTKREIRNQLLLTLGQLSLVLDKNSFQIIFDSLISFLNTIFKKANNNSNILDDEIFKCLADLLNNKEKCYNKIILEKFDIFSIIPYLFYKPLSLCTIEYLLSLMKHYENYSKENIFTTLISLNVISLIICNEEMKLDYITKYLDNNNINIDKKKITKIFQTIKKKIKSTKKNPNKINNIKAKINSSYDYKIITNSLIFLFYITNDLFYKDMFIFFGEKLIDLLNFVPNKIFKKIIDLTLCKFVKIYEDDVNLSQCILFKLVASLKNIYKVKNATIKEYILNIAIKKEIIIDIILKNKYNFLSGVPGILISKEEENVKKKLIELIGTIINKDSDRNYEFIFTHKILSRLINDLYHSYDSFKQEGLSFIFSYFVSSLQNFISIQLIEKILKIIVLLNIHINFNGIITINLLNSLKCLFNSEIIYQKYNNTINELCNVLFVEYISLLKDRRIDDKNLEILLEVLYYIIKIIKLDIYSKYDSTINFKSINLEPENKINNLIIDNNINDQNNINNVKKKITDLISNISNENISELLLSIILECENNNAILYLMKIFGLCGSMYPIKMEKCFNGKNKIDRYFKDDKIEITVIENKYDIIVYNDKYRKFEQLDISNEEPPSIISTVYLIQILNRDFFCQEITKNIIPSLNTLIKSVKNRKSNLIKILLLTIIEIIPKYDIIHQNKLFECISSIFNNFREISICYIDSVIKLVVYYLNDEYLKILFNLLCIIFEKYIFYIQNYYPILINKFIYLLKKNKSNSSVCIKLLTIIIKNTNEENISINIYLKIILEEFIPEFLSEIDKVLIIDYLKLFHTIIELRGIYLYYHIIIINLLKKIKQIVNIKTYDFDTPKNEIKTNNEETIQAKLLYNPDRTIILEIIGIFEKMEKNKKIYFFQFFPLIIRIFTETGIIKILQLQRKINLMIKRYENNLAYNNKIKFEINYCLFQNQCIYAVNKKNEECLYKNHQNSSLDKNSELHAKIDEKGKTYINESNVLYKIIENFQFTNKENWHEICQTLLNISFENTQSVFLRCCSFVKDYYNESSLISDLCHHCYNESIFSKLHDDIKKMIVEKMTKVIIEMKAPNDIIMMILNFSAHVYRKKVNNLKLLDKKYYCDLGKICYKCKAYAKSLCFVEGIFLINNYENFINLIKLYDLLNIPEGGIGLIKLAKKSNLLEHDKFKDYKCYICIKDYDFALKLINKKLTQEKEKENIIELTKNKEICLYGLYDWEKLLLEDQNENSINGIKINNEYTDLNSDNDIFNDDNFDNLSLNSNQNDNNNVQDNLEKNEFKKKIKRELMFIKASADLCKWDQISKHLKRIKNKFKNIFDINFLDENDSNNNNYNLEENEEDTNSNSILSKKTNLNIFEEKSSSLSMKNSFSLDSSSDIMKNKYIPFNDLIYKSENFCFLINNVDYLFDLNLFSSISFLNKKNYSIAEKYLDDSRKVILNNIKSLLNESYSRSFDFFIKNQEIRFMEDIIKYEKYHLNDKQYLKGIKTEWDKIFNLSINEPNNCKRLLRFFNLIFPVEEVYDKYIKLSNICRRSKLYIQSEKILNLIKKRANLNITNKKLLNEINLRIDLSHCKCLYEKGELDKALEKSKNIVKLFKDENDQYNKIDNVLKSKIFGEYALYLQYNLINNYYKFKLIKIFNNNINIKKTGLLKNDIENNHLLSNKYELNIINKKDINVNCLNHLNIKGNGNKQILDEVENINYYYSLACKYNKNNFKYWNNYASFNYKIYKYIYNKNHIFSFNSSKILLDKKKINLEISFAMNTLKSLRTCLVLSEAIESLENALKLVDIFINSAEENDDILLFISEVFNKLDTKSFACFFPQLLRATISNNDKFLDVFIKFIIRMASNHSQYLISIIIVMINSLKGKEQSLYKQILFHISKINQNIKDLIEAYIFYSSKLIKSAILLHEEWKEIIEISFNLVIDNDYSEIINKLIEMHEKMKNPPESLYEVNFHQKYGSELREAEKYLNKYISTKNNNYIKEAYGIYNLIYNQIINDYRKINNISLEYICPKLCNNSEILKKICIQNHIYLEYCDPISFELNFIKMNQSKIFIKKIENNIFIYNSKNHPRKITYIGTDDKEYKFLLKGHENLVQETAFVQLFIFINIKLNKEKKLQNKDLFIKTHFISPFTFNIGLISFVENYDSTYDLITEYRKLKNIPVNFEIKQIINSYPKYSTGNLLSKIEILKETIENNSGFELRNIIWLKSKNSESYVVRRTNYSRSLAVMSMVGYIIGLGDRHPNNILMDRKSGKLMHIDFGDCFEIAMIRNKYPEKIPFRLTKMFIKALEVAGVEGTFRIISEQIMELLRENKHSILFILKTFMYIPTFTFRFIISKIKKLKKKEIINSQINVINSFSEDINFSSISFSNNKSNIYGKFSKLMNSCNYKIMENSEEFSKKGEIENIEKKSDDKNISFINQFKEDGRKIKNEESLLIRNYEYRIKKENKYIELNNISRSLLNRIINKLNGFDFEEDNKLEVKDQVDRLINQAVSIENLAHLFLGWCPFM